MSDVLEAWIEYAGDIGILVQPTQEGYEVSFLPNQYQLGDKDFGFQESQEPQVAINQLLMSAGITDVKAPIDLGRTKGYWQKVNDAGGYAIINTREKLRIQVRQDEDIFVSKCGNFNSWGDSMFEAVQNIMIDIDKAVNKLIGHNMCHTGDDATGIRVVGD